ncbi:hypothetical protein MMC22_006816 [Lobaria immixta]|nr:hypothetical protein [Lobaria immixta]
MAKNISSERAVEKTEQKYVIEKSMFSKYSYGATNAIGPYKPEQSQSTSSQNTGQSQNTSKYILTNAGTEEIVLPKTSNGKKRISEASRYTSEEIPKPTIRVEDKARSPDRALGENQMMKAPRVVAKSKENAITNHDYLDQVNRLKVIRNENQSSKNAEKLAKPKEIAKNAFRAELELKQHEHVEAEARRMAILETQTTLMNKIVEDTKESLREVYAKQMKEEIYAQYDKTAAAHREEVKSELVKQLTPEIKALLETQYAAHTKDEATKQLDQSVRSESIRLATTLKSEVESKLTEELGPEVKTMLRAELTEPIKEELRRELKAEVYADREKVVTDYETETRLKLMHELIPTVEATMKKELQDQLREDLQDEIREEVRAKFTETQAEFENEQQRRLVRALRPRIEAKLSERLTEKLTPLIQAELRDEYLDQIKQALFIRFEGALRKDFLDEVKPQIEDLLTTQYTHKFAGAGGVRLTPEDHMQNELWASFEAALKKDLFEEIQPQVESILVSHYSAKLGQAVGMKLEPDAQNSYLNDMNRLETSKSVYDVPSDRDLRYQNNDHYDNQYDNGGHRHQNDDYDDSSRSSKRLNRDEQPFYDPSRFYRDEDQWFHGEQGDKTDRVDEVQEEVLPPSAFRGVKRSRIDQEIDENDYWGRSPKMARTSSYEGWEETGESGEETGEKGRGGVDTYGSSKEEAIDLVDSESETEALAPTVAAPIARRGPFLEDSDDEGYAETQRVFLGMLSPRPASTGQDAQERSSIVGEDLPEYESERELNGGKTLVAGGEGVEKVEE